MSAQTDGDREKAAGLVRLTGLNGHADAEVAIAATLAAEREAALAPVRQALADRYDATVKRRYALAEKFMDAGRWQLADAFRTLARQAAVKAARIRAAAAPSPATTTNEGNER